MKEHKISLSTAVLLTMNILIGSGILIGPGLIAAGSGNASFLAWPLVALLFLPLVLCTAQLSNMFPGCGGFYSYAKEGLNKTAGFISGWLYVFGYTFAIAVDVLAIRKTFIASGIENWLTLNPILFNIVFLTISFGLNLMGLKFISRILNSLTITKILPLIILVLLLPFILNPSFTITSTEMMNVPFSLPLAIFGFFGFEYCCSLTHLIENSEKNAPRAIMFGFLGTGILYTLFHFGLLNLMGADNLAQLGAPAFAQFITLPIPFLKAFLMFLIPIASILTIFAGANGMLNVNSILINSMAQEKLFLFGKPLTKLNKNNRAPIALFLLCVTAFLMATFIPHIPIVGGLCNLGVFVSFLFPFLSLFVIQKRKKMYSKLALTIVAISATLGFSIYSWMQLGNSLNERFINTLPLIIGLVAGYLLFFFRKEK